MRQRAAHLPQKRLSRSGDKTQLTIVSTISAAIGQSFGLLRVLSFRSAQPGSLGQQCREQFGAAMHAEFGVNTALVGDDRARRHPHRVR
jgi:hypothetical protein